MTERVKRQKSGPARDASDAAEAKLTSTSASASGERLKADLDDLLDEIDGVLESNAEEFVKNYVQKGGQ